MTPGSEPADTMLTGPWRQSANEISHFSACLVSLPQPHRTRTPPPQSIVFWLLGETNTITYIYNLCLLWECTLGDSKLIRKH